AEDAVVEAAVEELEEDRAGRALAAHRFGHQAPELNLGNAVVHADLLLLTQAERELRKLLAFVPVLTRCVWPLLDGLAGQARQIHAQGAHHLHARSGISAHRWTPSQ